jgi:hypothetical protein
MPLPAPSLPAGFILIVLAVHERREWLTARF